MLTITDQPYKRCTVINATGRIDSETAPQLEEAFEQANQKGQYNLVFNMENVDFISSAGLRIMIATQKTCKRLVRGELVLVNVPERILETLDLAGFVPLFQIFDNVTAAVGSF